MADTAWLDLPFEEAVQYLLEKKPMTKEEFDQLEAEAQDRAFTVARVQKLDLLQEVLDDLTQAAQEGMTLEEFISSHRDLGLTDAHLENVYRTNLQSAFGAGKFAQLTDSLISRAVWGWRYKTVEDDRVRPGHAALDGATFALGQHWEVFPPWGFNCRCASEIITNREARAGGIESLAELPPETMDEISKSTFASPALGMAYVAALGDYDLGLVGQFNNDRINASGGVA